MHDREPVIEGKENDTIFLRAVRSLAWNRQLLPIVQGRLDRAESIVRSQLLSRGEESIQAGPFRISLNDDQDIEMNWQGGDDWRQLHLPDIDALIGDPLDADDNEPL